MNQIDLHIHSNVSDGRFSPEEIVHKAATLGLTIIALTDHDSIDGIAPALSAAGAFPQLKIIPGVEISTEAPGSEVHVLGYFIDYANEKLKAALEGFRNSREIRAQRMIAKLENLGIHIQWPRVKEIAGDGSVGRPHLAKAMLEKGYITSLREAFTKYISHSGPAYAERDKMTPAEAVELVIQSDGLPVLAHPFTMSDPKMLILQLKAAGLVGIEAYYNDYTADQVKSLISLADRHNLIVTGGSDYHGLDDGSETMMGAVDVPMESAKRLIFLAKQRELKLAKTMTF